MKYFTKIFFIGLFSIIAININAQERFKRFYDLTPNYGSFSYNVTSLSDGYLLSGVVLDTVDGYIFNRLLLLKLDLYGNPNWQKRYGNANFQYLQEGFEMQLIDSALYLSTMISKPDTITTSVLIKYDLNGDSLWGREYTYSIPNQNHTWFSVFGKHKISDGGFVLTGTQHNGVSCSIILLKTDSLGNEEWRSIMNTSTYYSTGYDVTYDNYSHKYIITAVQDTPISTDELTGIIITTDSLGNKINQSVKTGVNGGFLNQIIQTDDHNFISSGAISTGEPIGSFTKKKHFCIKFDHNGNTIWSREYSISGLFNWLGVTEMLPDGNIILAGSFDTLSNQNLPFNSHFYLQKINPNGDSLWSRSINMVNGPGKQNLLNGLDLTNDQGFVLTGWFFGTLDSLDKRFCIAKLDEWGCDSVDCQLTGINENSNSSEIFTLLQNPIDTQLELILSNNKILHEYKIIDLKGACIKSGTINSSLSIIDISNITSGVYFLQVGNKIKIQTEKIVIIKN